MEAALGAESDYQALTPKEETDLESLMSQCEFAISNAESFAEQLAGDLSVLDGVSGVLYWGREGGDFCLSCGLYLASGLSVHSLPVSVFVSDVCVVEMGCCPCWTG